MHVFPYILSSLVTSVPKLLRNHMQPSSILFVGYKDVEATCGEGGVTGLKQPELLSYYVEDHCLGIT